MTTKSKKPTSSKAVAVVSNQKLVTHKTTLLSGNEIRDLQISVLIVGAGALGRATAARILRKTRINFKKPVKITFTDTSETAPARIRVGDRMLPCVPTKGVYDVVSQYDFIVVCIPSSAVQEWLYDLDSVLEQTAKIITVVIRTTLTTAFLETWEFNFPAAYIPEYETEYQLKQGNTKLGPYWLSLECDLDLMSRVFDVDTAVGSQDICYVIAHKQLRNAALATAAAFNNMAYSYMNDTVLDSRDKPRFTPFLSLHECGSRKPSVSFEGKCLQESLEAFVAPTLHESEKYNLFGEVLRANQHARKEVKSVVSQLGSATELPLVITGLHYNCNELKSSFRHSLAHHLLTQVCEHTTISSSESSEHRKEILGMFPEYSFDRPHCGAALLQIVPNAESWVLKRIEEVRSQRVDSACFVYDPLDQLTREFRSKTAHEMAVRTQHTVQVLFIRDVSMVQSAVDQYKAVGPRKKSSDSDKDFTLLDHLTEEDLALYSDMAVRELVRKNIQLRAKQTKGDSKC